MAGYERNEIHVAHQGETSSGKLHRGGARERGESASVVVEEVPRFSGRTGIRQLRS